MALSLGVQKGSRIAIGKDNIEIVDVRQGGRVDILANGVVHEVTDQERTLILPDVWVSFGRNINSLQIGARLAFDAPRHIRIQRLQ